MERIRVVATAAITALGALAFLMFWMHAPDFVAAGASAILFVAVLGANGDRGDRRALAADAAWNEAAPDLPPQSERVALERKQGAIRAPRPKRRAGAAIDAADAVTGEAVGPAEGDVPEPADAATGDAGLADAPAAADAPAPHGAP